MELELTAEQIDRQYNATMDSVRLINGSKPAGIPEEEWSGVIARNKEHIQLMLDKSFWTEQHDLTPFKQAVAE
jgi:hypothetical protein